MRITEMNEAAVKQICSWKYEYPYSVYNYLSYEEALMTGARITQNKYSDDYLCFWNESEILIGYVSLIKKADRLYLGIGLAPDYCSKGLGKTILLQSIEKARQKFGDETEIWVQVRAWNERAIQCYISCGFKKQYLSSMPDQSGESVKFCFMKFI